MGLGEGRARIYERNDDQFHGPRQEQGWRCKSVGHRSGGDAGHLHGSAGHERGKRFAAAHRRQSFGDRGREHLGTDVLPRRERNRASAFRMALVVVRTKKFLHVLRGAFHHQFFSLRICAEPGLAGFLSRAARRGRRSAAAGVAGNSGGKFSARKTGIRQWRSMAWAWCWRR